MLKPNARIRPSRWFVSLGALGIALLPYLARPGAGDPPAPAESGRVLYEQRCASCHGLDGRGTGSPGAPIPVLAQPDVLDSAEDDVYRSRIAAGHGAPVPPPLAHDAIDRIVAYVRSWQAPGARVEAVLAIAGDRTRGKGLYGGLCAGCHGTAGQGGIGSRLNSASFLAVADDAFLAGTIVNGRPGTAMKSWKQLSPGAIADLIAFLRAGTPTPPAYEAVAAARTAAPPADLEGEGALLFRVRCQACHGAEGRGGIAPRLRAPEFLSVADDRSLYRTITAGRPSTAMPAAPELSARELAALLAYLRSSAPAWTEPPLLQASRGDARSGAQIYEASCTTCHGADGAEVRSAQLSNPAFLRSASDGFLTATIVLGRTGTDMPAHVTAEEHLIEPEQIADVIAFLRQWEQPATWRAAARGVEVTEKNVAAGREHFLRYCSACHGELGKGVQGGPPYFAPALNDPSFLTASSDGFLLATIARGRSGTPMRPFGRGAGGIAELEPAELSEIVAYLRSWQGGK